MLNEQERKELKELAHSPQLKEDMRLLLKHRHNPFMVKGKADIDKLLTFLTEYNHFANHPLKTFRKIMDKDMRL